MAKISLSAERRELTGKAVKKLRRDGIIPIVVYGGPLDGALSLQASERELSRVLTEAGATQVVDLDVEGDTYPVLARVAQRHPTRHALVHVDFLAVDLTRSIQAEVPIVLVGEAPASELPAAVVLQATDQVTVEALPNDIPATIEIDISVLTELGQVLTVADLPAVNEYEIMTDSSTTLVSVTTAIQEAEEEPVEAIEDELEDVEVADGAETDEAEEVDADDDA